jgi:hypothetical protein
VGTLVRIREVRSVHAAATSRSGSAAGAVRALVHTVCSQGILLIKRDILSLINFVESFVNASPTGMPIKASLSGQADQTLAESSDVAYNYYEQVGTLSQLKALHAVRLGEKIEADML